MACPKKIAQTGQQTSVSHRDTSPARTESSKIPPPTAFTMDLIQYTQAESRKIQHCRQLLSQLQQDVKLRASSHGLPPTLPPLPSQTSVPRDIHTGQSALRDLPPYPEQDSIAGCFRTAVTAYAWDSTHLTRWVQGMVDTRVYPYFTFSSTSLPLCPRGCGSNLRASRLSTLGLPQSCHFCLGCGETSSYWNG